jgi:hypothetical protein
MKSEGAQAGCAASSGEAFIAKAHVIGLPLYHGYPSTENNRDSAGAMLLIDDRKSIGGFQPAYALEP